jgi:predicted phage terminase large subunit-like protein
MPVNAIHKQPARASEAVVAKLSALRPDTRARLLRQLEASLVRGDLTEWCRFCGYEPALHHRLLIDQLERLARGEFDRLAIFMPPGSAKSTYGSVLFPPWFMASRPGTQVLGASHTVELAERWSRKVRGLVAEHGPTLGCSLSPDSNAAGRWELTSGAEYRAAGVGVGIAGFRADLAIIDDPLRSRKDADSETNRNTQWEWLMGDLLPRAKPGNKIILIQTRWHEDDLAGRILDEAKRTGRAWRVISLPAVAEADDLLGRKPGEYLWDDSYGYGQTLRDAEREQTPRNWSALYQQRPAPETGDYFKEEWLRPYVSAPDRKTLATYGGSDFAVTADGGDYTCHVVIGIDSDDRLWLLDLWRGQTASDVWVETLCDMIGRWKPNGWAFELGQIKSGVGPFLEKRARERKTYTAFENFPTRGDKAVRAQSIRGRMAMMGLQVPANAKWYPDLRSELLSFPAGKHDDQVDALGLVGQLLDKMGSGRRLSEEDFKFDHKRDAYRAPSTDIPSGNVKLL